jgi:DNA replication and repair protein RecF
MISLETLNIENFKNLVSVELTFTHRFICFTGNNGAGKTNLLDALHYLAMGKSYFNTIDSQNINYRKDYFNLRCTANKENQSFEIFCAFVKGMKKKLKCNDKEYDKLSDHIGLFPVVMITPYDNSLITAGSEERRRFMDMIISQYDKEYLQSLQNYNRILQQRNAQLKHMFSHEMNDSSLLDIYNRQMAEPAQFIHRKRMEFMDTFQDQTAANYSKISDDKEQIAIHYKSQLDENDFMESLLNNFQKDYFTQRSNVGIHKDDLLIEIHKHPAKKFASQGQQKSILLAMKLAQFSIIKQIKGFAPLFLLDDIFDRLDRGRITRLMDILTRNGFGQVFITDTNAQRVNDIFEHLNTPIQLLQIADGSISQ